MDVAVGSVLKRLIAQGFERAVWSYDSNCSYSVNLRKRLSGYEPVAISKTDLKKLNLTALIPKFHLGGHKAECADKYSFNYTPDVGRMSGEGVEPPWYAFNKLQYSVREMGWGNRRDLLHDHLCSWNFSKLTYIGELLSDLKCKLANPR